MKKKYWWDFYGEQFFASNFVFKIAFARKFGAEKSGAVYTVANLLSLFLLVASLNIETGIGYFADTALIQPEEIKAFRLKDA